jgi:hypothetical protein
MTALSLLDIAKRHHQSNDILPIKPAVDPASLTHRHLLEVNILESERIHLLFHPVDRFRRTRRAAQARTDSYSQFSEDCMCLSRAQGVREEVFRSLFIRPRSRGVG